MGKLSPEEKLHFSRSETILSNTKKKVWKIFETGEEKGSLRMKWTN